MSAPPNAMPILAIDRGMRVLWWASLLSLTLSAAGSVTLSQIDLSPFAFDWF